MRYPTEDELKTYHDKLRQRYGTELRLDIDDRLRRMGYFRLRLTGILYYVFKPKEDPLKTEPLSFVSDGDLIDAMGKPQHEANELKKKSGELLGNDYRPERILED